MISSPSSSDSPSLSLALQSNNPRIMIVCLGDLGRSPRMQYHALSCAARGWFVDIIGLSGSDCQESLTLNPFITIHRFDPMIKFSLADSSSNKLQLLNKITRLILSPVKVISQCLQLLKIMLFTCHHSPSSILVQNPPSIPTLILALFVSLMRQSYFIIDWHNFGYSILSLSLNNNNPNINGEHRLTLIARWYEHTIGKFAHGHLCVTNAMKNFLYDQWAIPATVLYDRPSTAFKRLSIEEQHLLWKDLESQNIINNEIITKTILNHPARIKYKLDNKINNKKMPDSTLFTYYDGQNYHYRDDRPAVIISSTSWTADEDFNLLLTAIIQYERACEEEIHDIENNNNGEEGSSDDEISTSPSTANSSSSLSQQQSSESSIYDLLIDDSIDGLSLACETLRRSRIHQSKLLPPLLIIITGRGPLQAEFLKNLSKFPLKHSFILCPFLKYEDYPRLLGSVDLGLSFHTSSSGKDLPMKVVDMFGAELPVCAINFQCLNELLGETQGKRGFIFNTGEQLSLYLQALFGEFPNIKIIDEMRINVREWAQVRWDAPWNQLAAPVIFPPSINSANNTNNNLSSPLQSSTSPASQSPSSSSLTPTSSTSRLYPFLNSPLLFIKSMIQLLISLIKSLPLHWLYVLIFMIGAIIYRSLSTFLPVLKPFYNDPINVAKEFYLELLNDYKEDGIYGLAMKFAHSDIASWIVLCVIIGAIFWLFVIYRVNRAVADEQSQHHQQTQKILNRAVSGGKSFYSSLFERTNSMRENESDNHRGLFTSSEEEKEE